jgi:putative membrane protein
MARLTESDRERIAEAVRRAETKTSGEFVTVIAEASSAYWEIPTLAAAIIVFILSGFVLSLPLPGAVGLKEFYAGQVTVFIVLALLFRWMPLRMALVPKAVKRRRAQRLAHQQFLDLGLSSTRERTGVMLFVSVAEHYVEIIVDRGVQQHLDNATWERIIADFVADVRADRITDGFVKAIETCTDTIARHHPWHSGDVNELPNRLVQI